MTYVGGFDDAGLPSGSGSTLYVVRAVAVGGQLVRVVFAAEPKHRSASALDDGLNPSNYFVTVLSGTAQPPQTVGVREELVSYPAFGVMAAGEYALDVQVDRPLIVGLGYSITVQPSLIAADLSSVGFPYSAAFVGAARPTRPVPLRRRPGIVDFCSYPFQDGPVIDDAGDWAIQEGLPGTKKRCVRRATTTKGGFSHLPGYGIEVDLKAPMSAARLSRVQTDIAQQIGEEPDVLRSKTNATLDSRGYLSLDLQVRTSDKQDIGIIVETSQNGVTIT